MKTTLVAFISLVIGASAGYLVSDASKGDEDSPVKIEKSETKRTIAPAAADANMNVLRERIKELEGKLRDGAAKEEAPAAEEVAVAAAETQKPMGFRERMEKMKEEDPQRYQQMTNSFAQFRRSRARHAASRIEFLSSVDTSGMSASAKRTHEELQDVIAEREALEEKLHNPDLSDQERMELFSQMRQTDGRMRRLNEIERDNLLVETAKRLGFDSAEAKEISSAIKEVVDATSSSHRMHRFGGRR